MSMNIVCPHCNISLSVDPASAGSETVCPSCSGKFQVPIPTAHEQKSFDAMGNPNSKAEFIEKKMTVGIVAILLGGLGIHKFILGFNNAGIIMLVASLAGSITGSCLVLPLVAPFAMGVVGIIEGVIYLTKSDEEFYHEYAVNKKEWF